MIKFARPLVEQLGGTWDEMGFLTTISEKRLELSHYLAAQQLEAPHQYRVPRVEDGLTCGVGMVQNPFELRWAVELQEEAHLTRLNRLYTALHWVKEKTCLDWVGLYQKIDQPQIPTYIDDDYGHEAGSPSLVKICYWGAPSRALFPLSPGFARRSNNSRCFLEQQPVLAQDIEQLKRDGAPYYECDPEVSSEICIPISWRGLDVGLFDGEARVSQFFNPERLLTCLTLVDFVAEEGLLMPL